MLQIMFPLALIMNIFKFTKWFSICYHTLSVLLTIFEITCVLILIRKDYITPSIQVLIILIHTDEI